MPCFCETAKNKETIIRSIEAQIREAAKIVLFLVATKRGEGGGGKGIALNKKKLLRLPLVSLGTVVWTCKDK